MTKRAYPFEVGVLRQFKTHVHTFDCDKAAMKEIQSKTIEKLFLAQKSNAAATCQNRDAADPGIDKYRNMRQKQLSSYFVKKDGNPLVKQVKTNNVDLSNKMNMCTYCDKSSKKIYECIICFEQYCQACSFADYNAGIDEVRICITCS